MFTTTPPRLPQPTVEDVKRDAAAQLSALLSPWEDGTAADGSPLITARVIGAGAEQAMRDFANSSGEASGGDLRPQVDYSEPGVVACSWRRGGVWVRLWATDTALAAPAPTPLVMPAKATSAALSGRLPFSTALRNSRTPKEN
ncbi:hypothetical protein [Streptomyces platensis]|uniref:hypothetical protein n=1 Tax=Streptomyces platensis TaxID=58346 RepID=UPI003331044F